MMRSAYEYYTGVSWEDTTAAGWGGRFSLAVLLENALIADEADRMPMFKPDMTIEQRVHLAAGYWLGISQGDQHG